MKMAPFSAKTNVLAKFKRLQFLWKIRETSSTATSTQIPHQKIPKNDISKQHSKQDMGS